MQASVAEEIPSLKTVVHDGATLSHQAWDLLEWTLQDNPFNVKSLESSQVRPLDLLLMSRVNVTLSCPLKPLPSL